VYEKAADPVFGHRPDDGDIRDRAVGDPHLRPIDDPILAAFLRVCLHVGWVRSAVWLGESETPDDFAAGHSRHILVLLLLGAERIDRIHAQGGLHGDKAADARVTALELLADQSVTDAVQSRAVITLDG